MKFHSFLNKLERPFVHGYTSVKHVVDSNASSVKHFVSKAGVGIYKGAIKPAYKRLAPIANDSLNFLDNRIKNTDELLNSASGGISSIIKNPLLILGGLGVGAYLVTRS